MKIEIEQIFSDASPGFRAGFDTAMEGKDTDPCPYDLHTDSRRDWWRGRATGFYIKQNIAGIVYHLAMSCDELHEMDRRTPSADHLLRNIIKKATE